MNALITNEDGMLCAMHVSSNSGQSSSILDLHLHKEMWPEVSFTYDITLRSNRLPTALADIDLGQYDALVLDTQGTELLILEGAAAILHGFRYIKVEAADFEAYRNCVTVDKIDTFLRSRGFRMVRKDPFKQLSGAGEYFNLLFARYSSATASERSRNLG
jgi:hypothetical protein